MPKRSPLTRWRDYLQEGYEAFRSSAEFSGLRRKGLRILKRSALLSPEEWQQAAKSGQLRSPEYRAFQDKCRMV